MRVELGAYRKYSTPTAIHLSNVAYHRIKTNVLLYAYVVQKKNLPDNFKKIYPAQKGPVSMWAETRAFYR